MASSCGWKANRSFVSGVSWNHHPIHLILESTISCRYGACPHKPHRLPRVYIPEGGHRIFWWKLWCCSCGRTQSKFFRSSPHRWLPIGASRPMQISPSAWPTRRAVRPRRFPQGDWQWCPGCPHDPAWPCTRRFCWNILRFPSRSTKGPAIKTGIFYLGHRLSPC